MLSLKKYETQRKLSVNLTKINMRKKEKKKKPNSKLYVLKQPYRRKDDCMERWCTRVIMKVVSKKNFFLIRIYR